MNTQNPNQKRSGISKPWVIALLAVAVPVTLLAIDGYQLDVDPDGGGGYSNVLTDDGNGAVGSGNAVYQYARHSLAVGQYNSIDGSYDQYETPPEQWAENCMAVGDGNSISSPGNEVISSAFASGLDNTVNQSNAAAVGEYLIADTPGGTVVGAYNDTAASNGNAAFAVGTGTSTASESAFIVFKDGTVRIKRQGDISMGIYGN